MFKLNIDETTNSIARGPCPYASTVPCSDKITFDLGGLDFNKKFKIGLVDYTLQLTGFKEVSGKEIFCWFSFCVCVFAVGRVEELRAR